MSDFTPADWYWQVSGRTDYWSSATGAYVETLPEGWFATIQDAVDAASGDGALLKVVTPIASEIELSDVLRRYALRGPVISSVDVDAERDRRFTLGAPIDLGDGRTFAADIDDRSVVNITALALNATRAQAAGSADTIEFRDHSNVIQALSPDDVIAMAEQSMARVSAVYAASWTLKAMNPIPLDFDDGKWWDDAEGKTA